MSGSSHQDVLPSLSPARSTQRVVDSTLLLTLSALLIFNSHLEDYYPRSWMAADGLLGNTMFFMLSGYGIQSSLLAKRVAFGRYFLRRLLRLYPAFLLTVLTVGLPILRSIMQGDPTRLPSLLIWPTYYTYFQGIVPFYVLLYIVGRHGSPKVLFGTLAACLLTFLLSALADARTIPSNEHLSLGHRPALMYTSYFAAATIMGACLAVVRLTPKLTITRLAMLFALLLGYAAAKFDMVARGQFAAGYPLLLIIVFIACAGAMATVGAPAAMDLLPKPLRRCMRYGALITLEIYLVHEAIRTWPIFIHLPLPLNIAALLLATVAISEVIRRVTKSVRNYAERRLDPPTAANLPTPPLIGTLWVDRWQIWALLVAIWLLRKPFWPGARALRDGIAYSIGGLLTHVAHPPGSIGYCLLGGWLNHFVGSIETTFIDINLIGGLIATYLCYQLARAMNLSPRGALLAAAFYGLSINTLTAALTIAPHLIEGAATFVVAWFGLRALQQKQQRYALGCTLAVALIGALRPTASLFLIPLWLFSIGSAQRSVGIRRLPIIAGHVILFTVIAASWSVANDYYMTQAGYGGTTYEKQVLTVAPYDYVSMETTVRQTASRHTFHLPVAEVLAWLEPRLHVRLLPHIPDWPTPSLTRALRLSLQQAIKQATFVVVSLPAIALVALLACAEGITRRRLLQWNALGRSTWFLLICWITPAALFFVFGHLGTLTYLQNYLGALSLCCAALLTPRDRTVSGRIPDLAEGLTQQPQPAAWLTFRAAVLCAVGSGLVFAFARPLPASSGPINLLNVSLLQYTGHAKSAGYGASRVSAALASTAAEDPTADADYLAANTDAALIAAAYKHHFEYLKSLPTERH